MKIAISDIRTDGGTQPRDHINQNVVARYVEEMQDGAEFPPVIVFFDGEQHWLGDGFHRLRAHRSLNLGEINAEIRKGGVRDAVLYSCGANATHGYPRSNDDKRRAVMRLLDDPEWSQWSDREIARRCAVGNKFAGGMRHSICVPNTDSPKRKVERGGTTYTMNTANVGNRNPTPSVSTPTPPVVVAPDPPKLSFDRAHLDNVAGIYVCLGKLEEYLTIAPKEAAKATTTRSYRGLKNQLLRVADYLNTYAKELPDENR